MGIASFLGLGKDLKDPIDAVGNALDGLFTSDEERLTRHEVMEKIKQNPSLWQHTLDKINAGSSNWFIAAARPFCVWVSGVNMLQINIGIVWFGKNVPESYMEVSTLAFLGSLGVYATARTFEKVKDKAR